MDDVVTLQAGGFDISGWTSVSVTCGIEQMPRTFEIAMSERYDGELAQVTVSPGDPCVVKLGADPVVTGYVDRYSPAYDANGHEARIAGRGKCQDLVDCSAEWANAQISGASAVAVASKLAQPYGITVSCAETGLRTIPQFNLMLGETAFEVIDRLSRYSALLAYEQADGSLLLARTGADQHASGIREGANVQAASVEYSADQRYQHYIAYLQAINTFSDTGDGGNLIADIVDSGVTRNRKRYIIAEAVAGYLDVARMRAVWEMNRRNGRSAVASVTIDSWRDSAGELWSPNKLVSLYLPKLKTPSGSAQPVNWLISEVTYRMDERGTTADLVLMSPEAFDVEPYALQMGFVDGAVSSLVPTP